jgi:uncharacterized protein YndB with AHSA1/START domain
MEPLEFEFTVACSTEHAFDTWANKTSSWWPSDHSVSGESPLVVTFEPRPGGRIFERTPRGDEHDWGEIVAWDPPRRITYMWHIAWDRSDATEVDVSFEPSEDGTRVTIVHRGWERLGSRGPDMRKRNQAGWGGLIPYYRQVCNE